MNATTIIFVRHGETLWNQEGRYQGQMDSPLSKLGLDQAERVGEWLSKRRIDAVYTSDLKRAERTAECIAKHHKLKPTIDPRLREMAFGVWEGLTRQEVRAQYAQLWAERHQDRLQTRIPQGELPAEVVERLRSFLSDCTAREEKQTIVVVSHGGALRLILASLLGIPLEHSSCLSQSNTGVSELVFRKGSKSCPWEVLCLNSTSHLA